MGPRGAGKASAPRGIDTHTRLFPESKSSGRFVLGARYHWHEGTPEIESFQGGVVDSFSRGVRHGWDTVAKFIVWGQQKIVAGIYTGQGYIEADCCGKLKSSKP